MISFIVLALYRVKQKLQGLRGEVEEEGEEGECPERSIHVEDAIRTYKITMRLYTVRVGASVGTTGSVQA